MLNTTCTFLASRALSGSFTCFKWNVILMLTCQLRMRNYVACMLLLAATWNLASVPLWHGGSWRRCRQNGIFTSQLPKKQQDRQEHWQPLLCVDVTIGTR